jgi:cell cycle checkpoint control protein RAD9A
MQAIVDAFALKRLHHALICLTKYGEELTIYATPESLLLSTSNSSKTAYCRFTYQREFFSRYVLDKTVESDDGDIEELVNVQGQLLTKVGSLPNL